MIRSSSEAEESLKENDQLQVKAKDEKEILSELTVKLWNVQFAGAKSISEPSVPDEKAAALDWRSAVVAHPHKPTPPR